jgi:hypothetical protein
MGFIKFDKSSQPATTVPTITVQRSGSLSISRAAYLLLDSPPAVEFFWDAERHLIGVGAADKDALGSYPVRANGTGTSQRGPVTVSAVAFTKHVGLDLSEARRWVVKVEEGLLVFDVEAKSQPVKSNRMIGEDRKKAAAEATSSAT